MERSVCVVWKVATLKLESVRVRGVEEVAVVAETEEGVVVSFCQRLAGSTVPRMIGGGMGRGV
jgi:hypothetical protein